MVEFGGLEVHIPETKNRKKMHFIERAVDEKACIVLAPLDSWRNLMNHSWSKSCPRRLKEGLEFLISVTPPAFQCFRCNFLCAYAPKSNTSLRFFSTNIAGNPEESVGWFQAHRQCPGCQREVPPMVCVPTAIRYPGCTDASTMQGR